MTCRIQSAFILFFCVLASIAESGTVRGRITDRRNLPLAGVNVLLENTLLGSSTDNRGRYWINRVPPGRHMLRATCIGYASSQIPVDVTEDTLILDLSLDESPVLLDAVIVSASKHPQSIRSSHQSAEIVPLETIRSRQSRSIDEGLRSVAGIHMTEKDISIRGSAGFSFYNVGSRTLVMVDGIPVLTADLGGINWEILPMLDLDRVEVIKGAGSALYGSSAMGGVVNLLTRQPESGGTLRFRVQAGLYDRPHYKSWAWTDRPLHYERAEFAFGKRFGPTGIQLTFSRRFTTGYMENTEADQWNASGKWTLQTMDTRYTLYAAWMSNREGGFIQWLGPNDPLRTPPSNLEDEIQYQTLHIHAQADHVLSQTAGLRIRLSTISSRMGNQLTVYDPGAFKPGHGLGSEIQLDWLPHPEHHATFGIEIKEDLTGSEYFGHHRGLTGSLYAQNRWSFTPALETTLGIRWDHHTLIGQGADARLSPKWGLVCRPWKKATLRASAGSGFRAATVFERFIQADYAGYNIIPNPALKSERSWSMDAGFQQNLGSWFGMEFSVFQNDYWELIEPVINFLGTVQFQNRVRARIRGVEWSAEAFPFHWMGLRSAGAWMEPLDLHAHRDLPYRPRTVLTTAVFLGTRVWRMEAEYRYASRAEEVEINPLDPRVPVKVLSLRGQLRFSRILLQLALNNALNYHYTQAERRMGEIRNLSFSISYE